MIARTATKVAAPAALAADRVLTSLLGGELDAATTTALAYANQALGNAGAGHAQVVVQALPLLTREVGMTIPIRWVASGTAGFLAPVLDANLDLFPEELPNADHHTGLLLTGSFRPPSTQPDTRSDAVLLGHVTETTLARFLAGIATAAGGPRQRDYEEPGGSSGTAGSGR